MPTLINCPSCARQLKVPDSLLGKNVKCPSCSTMFNAGAAGAPEQIPEPPPLAAATYQPESAPAGVPSPRAETDDRGDEYDDRPRRRRRVRRDCEPHRAGTVLALGIVGLAGLFCCVLGVCAPIAWVMGSSDLAKMRNGTMDPEGEGTTSAGMVCGIIGTIIFVLEVLVFFAYLVFAILLAQQGGAFAPAGGR